MRINATIEKAPDSNACGIQLASSDVLQWFGSKGRIAVRATINGYQYRSSLSPMGGYHVLPVNATVRREAHVAAGDKVRVELERDTEPRTIEIPEDLRRALERAKALTRFETMSYTHRKEWINAINDAKRPQTREKRIADCIASLSARSKSPQSKK